MARVVNKRLYRGEGVYIGRPSIFGNPFVIGRDGTRRQVIARYEEWFKARLKKYSKFRRAVEKLRGKNLICWCAPLECHGDVILRYLEGRDS